MADQVYYVNGDWVDANDASLPISDLAIMRGYGVFEYLVTYNQRPFRLDDHLKRLRGSARRVGIKLPLSIKQIEALVLEGVKQNDFKQEKAIRVVVTGGISEAPDFILPLGKAGLLITIDPKRSYPEKFYQRGVKVITYSFKRELYEAKTLNYITAIKAQKKAKEEGAIEAIYVDRGRIREGTTTNLFVVRDGQLITQKDGILLGITRKVVLELAAKLVSVKETDVQLKKALSWDEAFIAASNKEIMPVRQIDDLVIGQGKVKCPGPVTRRIMKLFSEYTSKWGGD